MMGLFHGLNALLEDAIDTTVDTDGQEDFAQWLEDFVNETHSIDNKTSYIYTQEGIAGNQVCHACLYGDAALYMTLWGFQRKGWLAPAGAVDTDNFCQWSTSSVADFLTSGWATMSTFIFNRVNAWFIKHGLPLDIDSVDLSPDLRAQVMAEGELGEYKEYNLGLENWHGFLQRDTLHAMFNEVTGKQKE